MKNRTPKRDIANRMMKNKAKYQSLFDSPSWAMRKISKAEKVNRAVARAKGRKSIKNK